MDRRSICVKKKNAACDQALHLGKKAKKIGEKNSLGSGKLPFPSPQFTLGPPIFSMPYHSVFCIFPPTAEPGLSLLWTGPTAVHIRSQNSMKKNGETYQSRICFTKVKFLVDSGDLPTLIGNILEKKTCTYIRLMYAVLWLEVVKKMMFLTRTDRHYTCKRKTFTFNLLTKTWWFGSDKPQMTIIMLYTLVLTFANFTVHFFWNPFLGLLGTSMHVYGIKHKQTNKQTKTLHWTLIVGADVYGRILLCSHKRWNFV